MVLVNTLRESFLQLCFGVHLAHLPGFRFELSPTFILRESCSIFRQAPQFVPQGVLVGDFLFRLVLENFRFTALRLPTEMVAGNSGLVQFWSLSFVCQSAAVRKLKPGPASGAFQTQMLLMRID